MTGLLITVMNLPIMVQRLIAISAVALGVTLTLATAWAAVAIIDQQSDEITEARHALARFDQLIALDGTLSKEPVATNASQEFLAGATEPVIQAELQNKLNSLAGTAGATVVSAGGLPTLEKNKVKYVGVRASLQGRLTAIHAIILQLEAEKPYIIVRELILNGTSAANGGRLAEPIELSVQLSFFSPLNPAETVAIEGARP
ncbi:general secretion pathway protein GspM (plasmid) [Rhizobium lusitanum]|uniref:type II secretion system protein GspM n=1 Tax=Rhizobium lusitanum TaxID=293958 RepID=UPI00161FC1BF|nr:type II secretion system protein GspM [Rhizobium lusitanum]QND46479.1 general secretion pathway protein GspM [Rhizobium lusitanum]